MRPSVQNPCYLRRVRVRSLGWRTDLAVLAFGGSQVSDRGSHLVVRTPGNPDYWWGNFLLLRNPEPGSGGKWLARFADEFPGAGYTALGLDEERSGSMTPGEFAGMTLEENAVMTAGRIQAPPHPNTGAVFRPFAGDADWRQSVALSAAVHAGESGGEPKFLTATSAAQRSLAEARHGSWWGAFADGRLLSQLGVISVPPGLARYQNVETHPVARRRGLAGTLVWHAGSAVLAAGTRTLVMVADPGAAAIRVYRALGFAVTGTQRSLLRRPFR